jgi:hypothetical protein
MTNSFNLMAGVAAIALLAASGTARGDDSGAAATGSGKAAAHAALEEAADIPAAPPRLPAQACDRARAEIGQRAFTGKGDAARKARDHAEERAIDDGRAAHLDAANRAAQASVAAAVKGTSADSRAAAEKARTADAKASARGRGSSGEAHP